MLEQAILIATQAHAGQKDKGGQPYILHPLRVMLAQTSDDARMAAVLHDVLEDTPWTAERLLEEGIPAGVVEAVEALTRREDESYRRYVLRVATNPIARLVKMADLHDNMDPNRPGAEKHQARYRDAYATLLSLPIIAA